MKLEFPLHFRARLLERDISVDHIKLAISTPDLTEKMFEGRVRVTKKIGEKCIRVVYYRKSLQGDAGKYVIITAYYL